MASVPVPRVEHGTAWSRPRGGRAAKSIAFGLLALVVCRDHGLPDLLDDRHDPAPHLAQPAVSARVLPTQIDLTAFAQLFAEEAIGRWILNSTLLALMATVICIGLAIFGAYALSILRWRGRSPFAVFLLMTQMLPEALIIVPIFAIYRSMTERGIPCGRACRDWR